TCPVLCTALSSFSLLQRPPRPPLFPYTTLFRSSTSSFFCELSSRPVGNAAFISPLTNAFNSVLVLVWSVIIWSANFFSAALPFRSEEHTSELQSRENLVCRLLLEKKNTPAFSNS